MDAVILNAGDEAWIFEGHARRMSRAIGLEIASTPAAFNYVLAWAGDENSVRSFVPFESMRLASDKRLLADVFARHRIATPRTYLLNSQDEVNDLLQTKARSRWILKWPIGCGAAGHRLQDLDTPIPSHWPHPYILQEFIPMAEPKVYRLYCVANETLGWNVRRFPDGVRRSPFVAHANGARYEPAGPVPSEAEQLAREALSYTQLIDSFGCVDLIHDESDQWLVLEVGTDGIFNYVDRDIDIGGIADEIDSRIAISFRKWVEQFP